MKLLFRMLLLGIYLNLAACGLNEQIDDPMYGQTVNLSSSISGEKETAQSDEQTWVDVTTIQENIKYDMPTNAKEFIAQKNQSFQSISNNNGKYKNRTGNTDMYDYYLEAIALENGLEIIEVEGIAIEKDFRNLKRLVSTIQDEQHKRGDQLNPEDYDKYKVTAINDWKQPSERMITAVDYLTKLLHDLDNTINHDNSEAKYGFSYQAEGHRVEELEQFLQNDVHLPKVE